MKKIHVKIKGISPLLMHRPSSEMEELLKKARENKVKEETEKKNIHLYLYLDDEKKPCVPSIYLIRSMMKAGANFKVEGKGKKTYKNYIGSGLLIIEPSLIPIKPSKYEVHEAYVVIQRNRIKRFRPMFKKWSLEFDLYFDESIFTENILKEILSYAGAFEGIGDFRPNKGGCYGRFEVAEWRMEL